MRNPIRYTGREWDPETGLYYYRARYYDPHVGRFVSEDPIGLAGGINQYAYVLNDPINLVDPSGLNPCVWSWLITAVGWMVACDYGAGTRIWFDHFRDKEEMRDASLIGRGVSTGPRMPAGGTTMGSEPARGGAAGARGSIDWGACGISSALAVGQGLLDLAFFTGVGSGAWLMFRGAMLFQTGRVTATYGAGRLLHPGHITTGLGYMESGLALRAEGRALLGSAPGNWAAGTSVNDALAVEAVGISGLTWKNVVPGFATLSAIESAVANCRRK